MKPSDLDGNTRPSSVATVAWFLGRGNLTDQIRRPAGSEPSRRSSRPTLRTHRLRMTATLIKKTLYSPRLIFTGGHLLPLTTLSYLPSLFRPASLPTMHVTIVGAGLGGLGAAIALHSHGIQCTVYEQAPAEGRFAGAIMLSPNSLRILDHYGIYKRIIPLGFTFQYVDFQTNDGISTDHQFLGSREQFGYDALRISRNTMLGELTKMCAEKGIEIRYSKKFTNVVREIESDVTIKFADGEEVTTDLLIAADGIHSKIRQALFPAIKPAYNGILVVAGAVQRSKLVIPPNEPADSPIIQLGKNGAFVMAPQTTNGSEWLAGTQRPYPDQDRAGWEKIAADRAFQHAYLEEGIESRSELVQSAITNIETESMYIWPQHTLPKLERWRSEQSRVIIIGDAAHAIPPTSGQGANQAFEDGFSLAMVLARRPESVSFQEGLGWWQDMRQERIAKLLDMTRRLNNMRLPIEMQQKLAKEDLWESGGSGEGVRWLFVPEIEERVGEWVQEHGGRYYRVQGMEIRLDEDMIIVRI